MSATTHTQGPWVDGGRFGFGRMVKAGTEDAPIWIAVVYGDSVTPESEANVRLIVTAPKLLAALKSIVSGECPIVTHHRPDCRWCAALKAIAEAERGQ